MHAQKQYQEFNCPSLPLSSHLLKLVSQWQLFVRNQRRAACTTPTITQRTRAFSVTTNMQSLCYLTGSVMLTVLHPAVELTTWHHLTWSFSWSWDISHHTLIPYLALPLPPPCGLCSIFSLPPCSMVVIRQHGCFGKKTKYTGSQTQFLSLYGSK